MAPGLLSGFTRSKVYPSCHLFAYLNGIGFRPDLKSKELAIEFYNHLELEHAETIIEGDLTSSYLRYKLETEPRSSYEIPISDFCWGYNNKYLDFLEDIFDDLAWLDEDEALNSITMY